MKIVDGTHAVPSGTARMLLCLSHLRWNFVLQRPQHLMMRLARRFPVLFWEEPEYDAESPWLELRRAEADGVEIAVPHLGQGLTSAQVEDGCRALLDGLLAERGAPALRWYYTPMMLPFTRHLGGTIVYDCMDELSAFRFAPPELLMLEEELLGAADLVFTGGYSLYEAKKSRHPEVHPFPSSVDAKHFARARASLGSGRPRLGFYGVIDERMDLSLVAALADARPDWDIEMVGPVAKIEPGALPQRPNLHYPGPATYDALPDWLARWDVALMPFAIFEATRFISPTKTPEYLAAGRPVVSTAIIDVARHYGELEGVWVAATPELFVAGCDAALALARGGSGWLDAVDAQLAATSWDRVADDMLALINETQSYARRRAPPRRYDYVVVGAGFAGSVMAERLAADGGYKVLVIDRRPHVAGNAYDREDSAGILIHQYGPHIFHTNSKAVFDHLSRFTEWRAYEHRVLAHVDGRLMPIPINRTTLNALYGLSLETEEETAAFLASRAEPVETIRTSEDVVVSQVGRDLYKRFFRGYTRKQWGLDPSELDKAVTARVPTRTNTDDRYFTDSFQAMPADGYTAMFQRMLDHPNIELALGVDFADVRDTIEYDHLIYTGPIDEYFDHRFGKLPYRSLKFRHETLDVEQHQPVAVVNYPDEAVPYTRVTEYKHLTGQVAPKTSVTYEFPAESGDPYYPIPREENQALYKRYEALALAESGVTFVGRLATYRYYNMDQVVGQALATWQRLKKRLQVEAEVDLPAVAAS